MLRSLACFFGSIFIRPFVEKKQAGIGSANKILVFKSGAIGDVLMSTPFLRTLRNRFPSAELVYAVGKWAAPVLEGNPNINRVIPFDQNILFEKKYAELNVLIKQLRQEQFDLAFALDKSYLANIFVWKCKIPVRVGFDRKGEGFCNTINVPYYDVKHEVDYYLDAAYEIGAPFVKDPEKLDFFLAKQHLSFADKFLREHGVKSTAKLVAICPGGAKNPGQNMPSRRWQIERFVELAKRLVEKKYSVLIVGGPGDEDAANAIVTRVKVINASGLGFSLHQSAALIKKSRKFVAVDTGLMHIAAAVGTPVISIFGPTDPRRKAPRGKKHISLWKPCDCVRAEAYGEYPIQLLRNIENITVEMVFEEVMKK